MGNIYIFKPKDELDASQNIDYFIDECRNKLRIFGENLQFDDNVWDITGSIQRKGMGNKRERLHFYRYESLKTKEKKTFPVEFESFAKAYIRYMQQLRLIVTPIRRLTVLRVLDYCLREVHGVSDPVRIDQHVLNRTAQIIVDDYSESIAYGLGNHLNALVEFLDENRMTITLLGWKSWIKRQTDTVRVGKEFDEQRSNKMPSIAALNALPKIYRIANEPGDVLITSIVAILCSAPDRINEVLMLPNKCEVRQNRNGKEEYGLRWWPAKGADPMIKWVIPSMIGIVEEAISKIRNISNEARKIARWYENNSNKVYLLDEFEYLRGKETLNMSEVASIMYGCEKNETVVPWLKRRDIQLKKNKGRFYVKFKDLEKEIISHMPAGFPYLNKEIGIKYSDALVLVRPNELTDKRVTWTCMIYPPTINNVNDRLGHKESTSIFNKFDFYEPDGSDIKVATHQFRHWLNTLAQIGGMSQIDIAKWSGRTNIHQNNVYNHMTADQMLDKIRDAVGDEDIMFGPLAKLPKKTLISRDEFARLRIPTAHTTEFGYCVHDFTMVPCQVHLDCLNCTEHFCVKGDLQRMENIQKAFTESERLLASAKNAVEEGYYGAERWMQHQEGHHERLRQLCSIIDDPKIPNGAVIQLSNLKTPSPVRQAVEGRLGIESQPEAPSLPEVPSDIDQDILRSLFS